MESLSAAARLAALDQESPLAAGLAELASLAVRVDAGLLRRLRQALLPEADPGVESDLWFSAVVEWRGSTGFQLAGSVLPLLRQRLVADPGRRRRAARITRQAHVEAAAAIRLEEALNMVALAGARSGRPRLDGAAAAMLEPALRTLAQGGDAALDVARWAMRAADRLDDRVRRTRAAQTLLLAASLRLGMRRALAEPLRADLPLELLANALPAGGARRSIGVVRVAGGLQFREPDGGIASFEAPATDPLLVGLAWQAGGVTQERTVEAAPLAVVHLDGEPSELTLTTMAGDRYRLGSAALAAQSPPDADAARIDDRWRGNCLQLRPLQGEGATRVGFIVENSFGLTVAAAFAGVDRVVDPRSGRRFELTRSSTDDEEADGVAELVVLKPVADDVPVWPSPPLGNMLPQEDVAAKVAAIGGDGVVRWLDVVLQPRAGARRQALMPTAAGLGDTPFDEALLGAPVVDASGVVGAVVAADALSDGSSGVRLRLVEVDGLRLRLQRARQPWPGAGRRVVVVAVVEELSLHLDAVAQALRAAGHAVRTPDRFQSVRDTLAAVDDSELFVGLVGWRSGFVPGDASNPAHKPLLQLAFEHARERSLPCLMALSRREVLRTRGKASDDRMGMAAFREQLKLEMPVIEFDDSDELASRIVRAVEQLPERGAAPAETLDLRVVHGDIREAGAPLLVGHYDGDGICGVERQLDELVQGALSRRLALGLYPGPVGTSALVRGSGEGSAAPEVLAVGLGTIGELSPSLLSESLRAALLGRAVEHQSEAGHRTPALRASCLLVGSGEGGVSVGDSAIAIVEATLQANVHLLSNPGMARYERIEIIEAVRERASLAQAALLRWAKASESAAAVELVSAIEVRRPPKEIPRGDWWHRLLLRVDDRGAFDYRLTAGGRGSHTVGAESRSLVDNLLASTDGRADADPALRRTLTELLLPAGLLSPLLMVDRLALVLDAAAARYPWELLDRGSQPGRVPPLAALMGLVRQSAAPTRTPASPIDAGLQAGIFAADPAAKTAQPPYAKDIARALERVLQRAGSKPEAVVNRPATELMVRLHGEPLHLLHLAAPIAWPGSGPGLFAGFRFGPDLVLGVNDIRQLRALPQLVFCSPTAHDDGRPLQDWPSFAAAFAQDLLHAGVRAVVVPGWPVGPAEAAGFTVAFYEALAQGRSFGDCVLFARGEAWKLDPKGTSWAAFQCWGNPGLTLLPTGHRRSAR
ncbi:MAG: CHAT domain-containing protein [Burkholderiaceae bacterium]|nr:CHAT domain-containing protein [Burkholderiaceae bacterium]